jgi:hypothetical protein
MEFSYIIREIFVAVRRSRRQMTKDRPGGDRGSRTDERWT